MTAQIGSLDHILLWARDVEDLVAAYRAALDAVPIEESYPTWARIRLGNIDVGIREHPDGPTERGAHPVFRVHDLAALRARLGGTLFEVGSYTELPGGVSLSVIDPAGNALVVTQWGARLTDVEGTGAPS